MSTEPDPPRDVPTEETTLSDEEWPVAREYQVTPPTTASETGTGRTASSRRRLPPIREGGIAVAVLALLAVVVVIGGVVWLGSRDETSASTGNTRQPAGAGRATAGTTEPSTTAVPATPVASTSVPQVVGLALADARPLLEQAGLRVRIRRVPSEQPPTEILQQSPAAGSKATPNGFALLTVSRSQERLTVPDVVGLKAADATRAIREAGLQPMIRLIRSDEPAGMVVGQVPSPDETVERMSAVQLLVAAPARPSQSSQPSQTAIEIPDLVGLTASEARDRLREAGLRWTQTKVASEEPAGTVVGQSPGAGARLRKGQRVTLEISTRPAEAMVPDVTGLDEQGARQQLEAAGFDVRVVDQPATDPTEDGLVVDQNPTGGNRSASGSVVTLTVARAG